MVNGEVLLGMRDIARRFDNGTQALAGVSLELRAGEVHGLVGANGAGKSTLIAILSGALPPSSGEITWLGQPARWRRPLDARRAGIATLFQHVPLVPSLSALENILLARAGRWRHASTDRSDALALVERLGAPFPPDAPVAALSPGQRQMIGLAQALEGGARLLVMDEPTASLASAERTVVHETVRALARREGRAVLYVSHFLDEVLALTDVTTVLREGRVVQAGPTVALDAASLGAAISGRTGGAAASTAPRERGRGEVVLRARGVRSPGRLHGIDLDLRAGEITGLAGVLGSGRSELLHALHGADPGSSGEVSVDGRRLGPGTGEAVAAGLALVPEDRRRQGYVPAFSVAENLALPARRGPWRLDRALEACAAQAAIDRLGIRAAGPEAEVATLSGGNAQKVVVARWMVPGTRVLLLDEPTAGVDVAARADLHAAIRQLARSGVAVLVASSDFTELLALCDRMLVMREGRLDGEVDPAAVSEADLVVMTGRRQQAHAGVMQ